MKPEHAEYLLKNFKFLALREPSEIDCGDGWFEMIKKLCEKLKKFDMPNFKIVQIRERFGRLWLVLENVPEANYAVIMSLLDEAEAASAKICENCGKPGKQKRTRHVTLTMCDNCLSPTYSF